MLIKKLFILLLTFLLLNCSEKKTDEYDGVEEKVISITQLAEGIILINKIDLEQKIRRFKDKDDLAVSYMKNMLLDAESILIITKAIRDKIEDFHRNEQSSIGKDSFYIDVSIKKASRDSIIAENIYILDKKINEFKKKQRTLEKLLIKF